VRPRRGSLDVSDDWGKGGNEIRLPDHMIDLENIRDIMEGIADFFTGLDGWLDNLQSAAP
jgi:hypothetical protein